jgi:hypothetical protein
MHASITRASWRQRRKSANISKARSRRSRIRAECIAPVLVRNTSSTTRCGVVELGGGALVEVKEVPALGVRVVDAAEIGALPEAVEVKATKRGVTLSNGVIRAPIDLAGRVSERQTLSPTRRIANMCDARGRDLPLNQLRALRRSAASVGGVGYRSRL